MDSVRNRSVDQVQGTNGDFSKRGSCVCTTVNDYRLHVAMSPIFAFAANRQARRGIPLEGQRTVYQVQCREPDCEDAKYLHF